MGLTGSRRAARGDSTDTSNGNAYKYPPKLGSYFGNYFIMGGNRFESSPPDAYLFGENKDLNFLGSRPTPFPYPAPQAHEPTRTLKSLVNIRKDSLKFVRDSEQEATRPLDGNTAPAVESQQGNSTRYNIEFTFDTDVKCAITIYYFATEEIVNKQIIYRPRDPTMNSETFHYKRGANQVFSQPTHLIDPSRYSEDEEWQYNVEKDIIPVVIHCVVEEEEHVGHAHMTLAVVDKAADGSYTLKPYKQKQIVDGLCYLLQEIYGIENKNTERAKLDEDFDDNGSECVICMSETRDTLILPCRHLCLCSGCADNLRYQANNCPICRAKFRALLQLRAMRRKPAAVGGVAGGVGQGGGAAAVVAARRQPAEPVDEPALCQEGVPPGYEAVSLVEALNGPTLPHCALNLPPGGPGGAPGSPPLHSDTTLQSFSPSNAAAVDSAQAVGSCATTPESATVTDPNDISLSNLALMADCPVDYDLDDEPTVVISPQKIVVADIKSSRVPSARSKKQTKQKSARGAGEQHASVRGRGSDSARCAAPTAAAAAAAAAAVGKTKESSDEDVKSPRSLGQSSVEVISELSRVSDAHCVDASVKRDAAAATPEYAGGHDRSGGHLGIGGRDETGGHDGTDAESDTDSNYEDVSAASTCDARPLGATQVSPSPVRAIKFYQSPLTARSLRPADVDPLGLLGLRPGLTPEGGSQTDESGSSSSSSSKELLDHGAEGAEPKGDVGQLKFV